MWRKELLESPEFQRIIVDSVPTMVLVLDEHGRVAKVNAHFEAKTGFSAAAIVGRDWFTTFIPDEDRPQIQALFAEVLEKGVNSGHVNTVLTAAGGRLEVEWFARVITDPEYRTRWLLNVGHDITERLEHEHALEAAKREAERANAAKSRFLTTASHDLRQPLQTLMILNKSLERFADGAVQHDMLAMQREALAGMRDLLNTLLDIGKLESGTIKPRIDAVPIDDVFERIRAELAPLAATNGLELVIDRSALVAESDAALLGELLQNIVANAIRYTKRGSVVLTCRNLGARLEITVVDTGIGIGEEQLELIFDEFYQVDREVSNGGLGLGLSIVKRLAALLGCEIAVESKLGEGTTFRVRVPAAIDAAESPAPSVGAVSHGKLTGTVLLVDDDASVLAASRLLFELEGFDVIAAASADEVTGELGASLEPVDLIVTDYHLHDTRTGMDIVTAVRQRLGRTVPAIVVTGDTSPSMVASDLARLEVIGKPAEPEQLLATVQQLLHESS